MSNDNGPDRLIGESELTKIVSLSRAQIWRLEKAGQFPRRIKIAARRVGWLRSEIEDWILARAAERHSVSGAE